MPLTLPSPRKRGEGIDTLSAFGATADVEINNCIELIFVGSGDRCTSACEKSGLDPGLRGCQEIGCIAAVRASRRRLRRLLRTRQVSRRMHGADLSDRQFPDGLLRRGDEKRDAANFLSHYTGVRPTFPYSGLFSRVKPSSVPAPPGARSTGAGSARSALM